MFYYHQLLAEESPEANVATLPNPPLLLREDMKLTLSPVGGSGGDKCSNSGFRSDMWPTSPTNVTPQVYREVGFLTHLGLFCTSAKVHDCTSTRCREVFAVMEKAAPACSWAAFRHWALVAMSCQATLAAACREQLTKPREGGTFADELRMGRAHTHLVHAARGCFWILEKSREVNALFQPTHDSFSSPTVDLHGVCNIIYWMANIQAFKDLGLTFSRRWDHHYLLAEVTVPPILLATKRIRNLSLCGNRFWNFLNLTERKQSDLADVMYSLELRRDTLRHSDHNDCAPTKCQFSHKDSTTTKQLHKCKLGNCEHAKLPIELLMTAAELGDGMAWSRSCPKLNKPGDPYIAISHVWSDGTGVGLSSQGLVNHCLFDYFGRIAETLKCEGIWWDAISIPLEPKARAKAISQMHKNYADAEYTVVHDQYLLGIEYTDSETACLAIVLSPWFTRGWTALELRMSNRVKVLFKGPNVDNPDIKDLDLDILARDPGIVSRAHWLASSMISRLRTATIEHIEDILAILRPRSTSWVRDRTVIAALLLGVPRFDYSKSEGEITCAILAYLGLVPYSALLHGMPTMFESGPFSWCPATLDDMPIDLTTDLDKRKARAARMLQVSEKGAVTGWWYCEAVTARQIKNKRLEPHGFHISVAVHFYNALFHWENCLILREREGDPGPALLVVTVRSDPDADLIDCGYVGAVRISEDDREERRGGNGNVQGGDDKDPRPLIRVRIGNENGRPARPAREVVADWLAHPGNPRSPRLGGSSTPATKPPSRDLGQGDQKHKERFEKRLDRVDSPWYKAPGVKLYSPSANYQTKVPDNDDPEPTSDGHLARAFQSPNAESLIHLLISRGARIPTDVEDALTFDHLSLLSQAYLMNDMRPEAESICRRATRILQAPRSQDELSNLETILVLARVCWKLDLTDKAKDAYVQAIDKCVDLKIVQHRRIRCVAAGELSLLLAGLEKTSEASTRYQGGLEAFMSPPRRVYAFEYHTASRMKLPYSQRNAEDAEAEKTYKAALRMLEKEPGRQHAITLVTSLNLAIAILYLGDVAEAEDILNNVIRDLEKHVGRDHLLTLRAKLEMARIHALQGRMTAPKQINGLLGDDIGSPTGQHWLSRLESLTRGAAYESMGLLDDAIQPLQCAQRRPLGQADATDSYLAACAKRDLGIVYARLGRLDEARDQCQEALLELRALPPPETMEVFVTLFCLGVIRAAAADEDGAGEMFRESLAGLERLCGPTDAETREVVGKLGRLCKPMVMAEASTIPGSDSANVLRAIHQASNLLERCGDVVGSRVRVERAFEGYNGFFTAPTPYPRPPGGDGEELDPQPGEIVVRVVAVAISRAGWNGPVSASCDPDDDDINIVDDVAGEVYEVRSEESRFRKGDRVLGHTVYSATQDERHEGLQEHAVLLSKLMSRIPDTLSFEDAAVLPSGISTAAAALFQDEFLGLPQPQLRPEKKDGQALLVMEGTTSAGTSAGTNAIQLATAAGLTVIVAALPKNFAYVKMLGANQVVDSCSPSIVTDLANALRGYQIAGVFDASGSANAINTAIAVLCRVPGKKMVVSVSKPPRTIPSGIIYKVVTATDIKENGVSKMIYEQFLPSALEIGRYIVTPGAIIAKGRGSIEASLDAGKKVVYKL